MHIGRITLVSALVVGGVASAQEADVLDLGTITMEAESDATMVQDGYVAQSGQQATRVDTDIRDIPQSVSIVTQDQIEDQQPRQLLEALSYSAGTGTSNFAFDQRYDAFYLRGFTSYSNGIFRDGLRQINGLSAWYNNDTYTLEGAAILKGPSSSLYGVSGPGGLVNLVSKRPKDEAYNEIKVTTGTDNMKELAFDSTGPVGDDGRLTYRLTGLTRDADTPLDGVENDRTVIAPSFSYQLTDSTKVTVLTEYSDINVGGSYAYYNPSYGVAAEDYLADPDYNSMDQEQWRVGYEIENDLSSMLTLRHRLRYSEVRTDLLYNSQYDDGTDTLAYYYGHYYEEQSTLSTDVSLEAKFDTGQVSHTLITGLDYSHGEYDAYLNGGGSTAAASAASELSYYSGQETDQTGVFIHDQMTLGRLGMFASMRYDWVETVTTDSDGATSDSQDEGLTGRIGLTYQLTQDLSAYGSVSSSFAPNTGLVYDDTTDADSGHAADATRSHQKEIGLKYQLAGTESLLSAALFDIKQKDGVVYQTVDSTVFGVNQVQVPYDLRSRGLELEANINFNNGLRMISAYTYTDMTIENGSDGTDGNTLSATPTHSASLWGFYEPQYGALQGFGFGAGLRYVGSSWGDDENTFKNDSALFADLAMTYDFAEQGYDGTAVQVNIKNLFNNEQQTCSAGYCYRYEGVTGTVSLTHRF
jgi:iron complex outermembrane receptor protein